MNQQKRCLALPFIQQYRSRIKAFTSQLKSTIRTRIISMTYSVRREFVKCPTCSRVKSKEFEQFTTVEFSQFVVRSKHHLWEGSCWDWRSKTGKRKFIFPLKKTNLVFRFLEFILIVQSSTLVIRQIRLLQKWAWGKFRQRPSIRKTNLAGIIWLTVVSSIWNAFERESFWPNCFCTRNLSFTYVFDLW